MRDENLHAHYTWEAGHWRDCARMDRLLSVITGTLGVGVSVLSFWAPLAAIMALLLFGSTIDGLLRARNCDRRAIRADKEAERWKA